MRQGNRGVTYASVHAGALGVDTVVCSVHDAPIKVKYSVDIGRCVVDADIRKAIVAHVGADEQTTQVIVENRP